MPECTTMSAFLEWSQKCKLKGGVWCRGLKMRVILSDYFEDEAIIDLLDTFRIYLSTHNAHTKIFLVSKRK